MIASAMSSAAGPSTAAPTEPEASAPSKGPITLICIGMAGSGKTTFMQVRCDRLAMRQC